MTNDVSWCQRKLKTIAVLMLIGRRKAGNGVGNVKFGRVPACSTSTYKSFEQKICSFKHHTKEAYGINLNSSFTLYIAYVNSECLCGALGLGYVVAE